MEFQGIQNHRRKFQTIPLRSLRTAKKFVILRALPLPCFIFDVLELVPPPHYPPLLKYWFI